MTARLKPTGEQQHILDAVLSGGTVAISAAAGSGKTSTLRMIAEALPDKRMLYLAYNKTIQLAAERDFPSNVTCKTAHALAYREFGAPIRQRLNGPRVTGAQAARILGVAHPLVTGPDRSFAPAALAAMAVGMVSRFCRSPDDRVGEHHFVPPEGLEPTEVSVLARRLTPLAHKAWQDLTAGPAGKLKPTHDVYLKQWQLSRPRLTGWDLILYEAQDADAAIADVVEHQDHAQLVAVGDSAQAIYAWRGAGDFLARVGAARQLRLTQSWRFGSAIAEEANTWLEVIGTDLRLVGNPQRSSALTAIPHPDAVLCRSNAGTLDELLAAHDAGVSAHLVGDGRDLLALAHAAQRLQNGQPAGPPSWWPLRTGNSSPITPNTTLLAPTWPWRSR